jgi:hypothetical protein
MQAPVGGWGLTLAMPGVLLHHTGATRRVRGWGWGWGRRRVAEGVRDVDPGGQVHTDAIRERTELRVGPRWLPYIPWEH